MTILEIGCGPVQPLARELARTKFLNDKYKVDLISINPIKERSGAYTWEKEQFESIQGQYFTKMAKVRQVEKLRKDMDILTKDRQEQTQIDDLLDRPDLQGIEGTKEKSLESQMISSKRKLLENLES